MTRGAAPLVSNPQELLFETPNKKRRRVEEIAPSNASSNFDPISPHRYPQSTPRRPLKPNTPQSEARRRSAPSRLFNRPLTPIGQIQDERDLGGMDLKQEKTVSIHTQLKITISLIILVHWPYLAHSSP
jgi:hypothetical protein